LGESGLPMPWAQGVTGSNPVAPTISSLLRWLEVDSDSERNVLAPLRSKAGDLSGNASSLRAILGGLHHEYGLEKDAV
jgi:hypothetical protein